MGRGEIAETAVATVRPNPAAGILGTRIRAARLSDARPLKSR